jgi:hypothetical protein
MAFWPGRPRPTQLFLSGRGLSGRAFASSAALHTVLFALAAWATGQPHGAAPAAPALHLTRTHAVHYLVLPPDPPEPTPEPERRPASRTRLVAPIAVPKKPSSATSVTDEGSKPAPPQPPHLAAELPSGSIAGVGPGLATGGADAATGSGLYGRLGFRRAGAGGPGTGSDPRPFLGEGDPTRRGATRVVELVSGAGTACPELRRPPGQREREVVVAIAFVVDTSGAVDPATLQVIESPDRLRTEHRYYSHIYAVSTSARIDGHLRDIAAGYDSVLTEEVASHVRGLLFRPAMRKGRVIRSTVLVSCQSPESDHISAR